MADLVQKIHAEFDNVEKVIFEIKKINNLSKLSYLELAGAATLIHNLYMGIENVLKQILLNKKNLYLKGLHGIVIWFF